MLFVNFKGDFLMSLKESMIRFSHERCLFIALIIILGLTEP